MSTDRVLMSMRAGAWERAKAELRASLATYHGEIEEWDDAAKAINEFIKLIEDNGYLGT